MKAMSFPSSRCVNWILASWYIFIFYLFLAINLLVSSDIYCSLRVPLLRPITVSVQSLTVVLMLLSHFYTHIILWSFKAVGTLYSDTDIDPNFPGWSVSVCNLPRILVNAHVFKECIASNKLCGASSTMRTDSAIWTLLIFINLCFEVNRNHIHIMSRVSIQYYL